MLTFMSDRDRCHSTIEELVVRGFVAVDSGKAGTGPATTDDFALVLPNMTIEGVGYQAFLVKRATATHTTRHCVSNFRVMDCDDTSATVGFIVTAHRREVGDERATATVADFVDQWVVVDGTWLHRSRSITPAFPAVDG
jgi:SnoaL-like domain